MEARNNISSSTSSTSSSGLSASQLREIRSVQFRQYLTETGLMDAMTSALLSVFEGDMPPEDVVQHVYRKLTEYQNGILKKKLREMEAELETVKRQVEAMEESTEGDQ